MSLKIELGRGRAAGLVLGPVGGGEALVGFEALWSVFDSRIASPIR
jgi:hypothetical protein